MVKLNHDTVEIRRIWPDVTKTGQKRFTIIARRIGVSAGDPLLVLSTLSEWMATACERAREQGRNVDAAWRFAHDSRHKNLIDVSLADVEAHV